MLRSSPDGTGFAITVEVIPNGCEQSSNRIGPLCKKEDVNSISSRCLILFRVGLTTFLRISALLLLSLSLIACGSGSSTSTPSPKGPNPESKQSVVSEIRIAPNSATLFLEGTQQFTATALDEEGQAVQEIELVWATDDPEIAQVSSRGMVEGLNEGEAILTASFGEKVSNRATIKVVQRTSTKSPIFSVEVASESEALIVGVPAQFAAIAKDEAGNSIPEVTFTWSSSKPEIVSIDQSGLATPLAPGNSTITAMADDGKSQSMAVTVSTRNAPPTAQMTTSTTSGIVPLTVTFDATKSSDRDGSILSYSWSFGDGSPPVNGAITSHTYQTAGEYTAKLVVTDNQEATSIASAPITVNSPPAPPAPPGTGWKPEGIDGDLFGVHFVSASEGWTVGLNQVIAHTTDGGVSWTVQNNFVFNGTSPPSQARVDFYDVFFVNAQTGWAVGWPQAIFKTTDGGASWVEQHLVRNYWQLDQSGQLQRTTWCESWNEEAQSCSKKRGVYLRKVQFADSDHGWSVGRFGFIFKTDNGGATWRTIPQNSTVRPLPAPCVYPSWHSKAGQPRPEVVSYNPHLFTLDVISPNEVWIGGGSEGDEPCATGWLRMLGHTTDGGQTWRSFYEAETGGQLEGNGRIFDMKFSRNANGSAGATGWAVGGNGTVRSNVLQTTDGGQTWHQARAASSYGKAYYGIAFLPPSRIWLAGWGGLILHSQDGGVSWQRQTIGTSGQLRRLYFFDDHNGWIAGQGQVFRTASGGN